MGFLVFIINTLYTLLVILLIARMIISFTTLDYYHPIRRIVHNLTEPVLAPVRRMMPQTGGVDFSPVIVLLIAYILRILLIGILV
jgi:YggT family protein